MKQWAFAVAVVFVFGFGAGMGDGAVRVRGWRGVEEARRVRDRWRKMVTKRVMAILAE